MIVENGIVTDPKRVGFYSGVIESLFALMSFISSTSVTRIHASRFFGFSDADYIYVTFALTCVYVYAYSHAFIVPV